ncbi:hypothetical protein F1880_003919 [Penicillium rolfsii]|nr:hypothetical protein F1880_003919 [Penicillium rolfsii]
MPPAQHPYPRHFSPGKGIRAFTGHLQNGHPHPIFVDIKDGTSYPLRERTTRCSSPTTPPAERRAYAAREEARKTKNHPPTGDTSEGSTSVPPKARQPHTHKAHSKRQPQPEPEYLPQTHKHSTKRHRKASKPVELPHHRDCDAESKWSTNVHVPLPAHHPHYPHYHHHHDHPTHSGFYTIKAPFTCHCSECYQSTHQPIEVNKENPVQTKYVYEYHPHPLGPHPAPVDPQVPCRCGYVHVEPAREQPSRSTSPDKHRKGHRKHSAEPEEGRHRHRRRRHRRHRRYTSDSSSDTTNADVDQTSSESDEENQTATERVEYEVPNDWQFCNECCCGHPVFYILR